MSANDVPRDAAGEDASTKLNEGLKTCQAVVANYRAMLAPVAVPTAPEDVPVPNDGDAAA